MSQPSTIYLGDFAAMPRLGNLIPPDNRRDLY
jgi:hypothetical protein